MEDMFNVFVEYMDVATKISNIICSNEPIDEQEMKALKIRHFELQAKVDVYKEVVANVEKKDLKNGHSISPETKNI